MMAKGIVITPDGAVTVQDFAEPLYETVGAAVDGLIEIVRPEGLPDPYVMICNEEGRLVNLPYNPVASLWYGTQEHGHPILGTVVVMQEGINAEHEPDLTGLDELDVDTLTKFIDFCKTLPLPEAPKDPPPAIQVYEIPQDVDFGDFVSDFVWNRENR